MRGSVEKPRPARHTHPHQLLGSYGGLAVHVQYYTKDRESRCKRDWPSDCVGFFLMVRGPDRRMAVVGMATMTSIVEPPLLKRSRMSSWSRGVRSDPLTLTSRSPTQMSAFHAGPPGTHVVTCDVPFSVMKPSPSGSVTPLLMTRTPDVRMTDTSICSFGLK